MFIKDVVRKKPDRHRKLPPDKLPLLRHREISFFHRCCIQVWKVHAASLWCFLFPGTLCARGSSHFFLPSSSSSSRGGFSFVPDSSVFLPFSREWKKKEKSRAKVTWPFCSSSSSSSRHFEGFETHTAKLKYRTLLYETPARPRAPR